MASPFTHNKPRTAYIVLNVLIYDIESVYNTMEAVKAKCDSLSQPHDLNILSLYVVFARGVDNGDPRSVGIGNQGVYSTPNSEAGF
jgi:hypothetical protein